MKLYLIVSKQILIRTPEHTAFILILVIGFSLRLLLNNIIYSFDAASFLIWARYLTTHSLAQLFEFLPDGYTPYPPIYYYVLKLLGMVITFTNSWRNEWVSYAIIKVPVFTADVLVTAIVYWFTRRYLSMKSATLTAAFYYLHPAIIYNTSIWGQIDSVIIAIGILGVLAFIRGKNFLALGLYMTGVMTKLQMLALLPIILFLTSIRIKFRQLIFYLIILIFLGSLPFIPVVINKGVRWTWDYFFTIPNWYAYTSIYTYNLWAPFGFVLTDNTKFFSIIEFKYIGIILFWIVACIIIAPLYKKLNRTPPVIMFAAFLLWYDFSFFATRIHSRYLIYSFGFFAPFFMKFPLTGIMLSILMFANFLLPEKSPLIAPVVAFLNRKDVIYFFVAYAFVLFILAYRNYRKLLHQITPN